jgi:CBS-domain-containing membrane protein
MNKQKVIGPGPQHGLLFRFVALLTRFQLNTRLHTKARPQLFVALFAILSGSVALATITAAAVLTDLPLLFPPLAPSAFILFFTPMAVQAAPRNVILAHTLAVAGGLVALRLVHIFFPTAQLADPAIITWPRVLAIALAMALATLGMVALRCTHPPAAASGLLAAMGYLSDPMRALGLCLAAVLLVLEAMVFNRLLGGLPYPWWRADPNLARRFGALAGLGSARDNYWQQMTARIHQGRPATSSPDQPSHQRITVQP